MDQIKHSQEDHPKMIPLDSGEHLSSIESGEITVDIRVAYPGYAGIKPGKILEFTFPRMTSVRVKVAHVRIYKTLEELKANEDINKIAPRKTQKDMERLDELNLGTSDKGKYSYMAIEFERI